MGPEILKSLQLQHREHPDWDGNCSASDCKALQRVVLTAQYITGAKLPAFQDLYASCQTPATLVIDCSLYYRMASGTGAPDLGPRGF